MELSWELEQIGRAAAPDTVFEGLSLADRVSDIIRRDDGSIEALVRGEDPHAVSLPATFPLYESSCTCGANSFPTQCVHVIAVSLRNLQLFHGLDDARTTRWVRHVEGLRALENAWSALAEVWLEATQAGDATATGAVLRDVGSVHGAMQVAKALGGRATVEEHSAFLLHMAAHHGIDGTAPLGSTALVDARALVDSYWSPRSRGRGAAWTGLLLALVGSARRTVTDPSTDLRVEHVVMTACGVLGQLVTDGHADPSLVADALLDVELDAPTSQFPWSAFILEALGPAAPQVAHAMQEQLRGHEPAGGWATANEPRFRLRAEIGLASAGVPCLIAVLEEWPEAPYDEYLRRLQDGAAPTARVELLESAHRHGRTAWSPGWAAHTPASQCPRLNQLHRIPRRAEVSGTVAIGDLVLAQAQLGRSETARDLLLAHAQRHDDPAHRYEFLRIWKAATLGPGEEASATDIFGPESADDGIGELLEAISGLPDDYFDRSFVSPGDGLGAVLLTAVLIEDIPAGGGERTLDAPTWVESFFSVYPDAADDLDSLAKLPAEAVADWLEGPVPDRDLALRIRTIARQLIDSRCPIRSIDDLHREGLDAFVKAIDEAPAATPVTAALFEILLGNPRHPGLGPVVRDFLCRDLTVEPCHDGIGPLLEATHALEPRGPDVGAYQLAIVLAGLDGSA